MSSEMKRGNRRKSNGGKYRVSWKTVLHPDHGYGPLKGKTLNETRDKFYHFRQRGGKDIKTLAQYVDYMNNNGKVGLANIGRKRA